MATLVTLIFLALLVYQFEQKTGFFAKIYVKKREDYENKREAAFAEIDDLLGKKYGNVINDAIRDERNRLRVDWLKRNPLP